MKGLGCDGSYLEDLKSYTEGILKRSGISSPAAEREILRMADAGNTVACKLYADLLFYKKVMRKHAYRDAFMLYRKAAGIRIDDNGEWTCSAKSYPAAFWNIGYYLMNYRRESFLKDCEEIPEIGSMTPADRKVLALELSVACMKETDVAGAVNLVGRILKEASEDPVLYERCKDVLSSLSGMSGFAVKKLVFPVCDTQETCEAAADLFFETAAGEGYSYACNNLALREADRIIAAARAEDPAVYEYAVKYEAYLKNSADRYEPYAANRLGLYYLKGEIKGSTETICIRAESDHTKAREYFKKAIVYPDRNSAWAYYNLIKYFYKDYHNDLELLNEHMDCIRQLNPEVYDLAMDL